MRLPSMSLAVKATKWCRKWRPVSSFVCLSPCHAISPKDRNQKFLFNSRRKWGQQTAEFWAFSMDTLSYTSLPIEIMNQTSRQNLFSTHKAAHFHISTQKTASRQLYCDEELHFWTRASFASPTFPNHRSARAQSTVSSTRTQITH